MAFASKHCLAKSRSGYHSVPPNLRAFICITFHTITRYYQCEVLTLIQLLCSIPKLAGVAKFFSFKLEKHVTCSSYKLVENYYRAEINNRLCRQQWNQTHQHFNSCLKKKQRLINILIYLFIYENGYKSTVHCLLVSVLLWFN